MINVTIEGLVYSNCVNLIPKDVREMVEDVSQTGDLGKLGVIADYIDEHYQEEDLAFAMRWMLTYDRFPEKVGNLFKFNNYGEGKSIVPFYLYGVTHEIYNKGLISLTVFQSFWELLVLLSVGLKFIKKDLSRVANYSSGEQDESNAD